MFCHRGASLSTACRHNSLSANEVQVSGRRVTPYYLADRSQTLKTSTLQRRLATISEAHRAAGVESPTKHTQVRYVWAGICREKGMAQGHAKPTLTKHIRGMVDHLPDSL